MDNPRLYWPSDQLRGSTIVFQAEWMNRILMQRILLRLYLNLVCTPSSTLTYEVAIHIKYSEILKQFILQEYTSNIYAANNWKSIR
mmetsp:Transcript_15388/g.23186  ORF Transcript_15388/g.23186 Transcript_15388/m.23186 type:complete len:86 (+) Transcript_15388:1964-2221(+)